MIQKISSWFIRFFNIVRPGQLRKVRHLHTLLYRDGYTHAPVSVNGDLVLILDVYERYACPGINVMVCDIVTSDGFIVQCIRTGLADDTELV